MSEYRTDEETLEQLSRWWDANGIPLMVALVLVIAGVFGWDYWTSHRQEQGQRAAGLYQDWLRAARSGAGETSEARADELAANLKREFPDSGYVAFIALERARAAYEGEDPDGARAHLEEVLALDVPASLRDLALLRIARLDLDVDDTAAALGRLNAMSNGGTVSAAEELRGDALLLQGDRVAALAAYRRALDAASGARPLLQMKIDDLADVAGGVS